MSYATQAALLADETFRERVLMALGDYAFGTVYAEAGGTANHAERVAHAKEVINDPFKWLDTYAVSLASINTLANTDLGVLGAVGAHWNRHAGVTT